MKLRDFLPLPHSKAIPDMPDIVNEVLTNFRDILPPKALSVADAYKKEVESKTHKIKCQLAIEAAKGKKLACERGKREKAYQESLQRNRFANRPQQLKGTSRSVEFPNRRGITTTGINQTRINQNGLNNSRAQNRVKFSIPKSKNEDAFDPDSDESTLGNRAVLFDANGKVVTTANEIAREGRAVDESAKLATDKKPASLEAKKLSKMRSTKSRGMARLIRPLVCLLLSLGCSRSRLF
jgi:hypothetical protein